MHNLQTTLQHKPDVLKPDIILSLDVIILKLRKLRSEIEKKGMTREQATMLYDLCNEFHLTLSQKIFVVGLHAMKRYGLYVPEKHDGTMPVLR